MHRAVTFALSLAVSLSVFTTSQGIANAAEAPARASFDAKTYEKVVSKAIEFLGKSQAADGSFSAEAGPAVTALVATGILQSGRSADDPVVLIRNGTLVDGTRAPRFAADIAVSHGSISAIGTVADKGRTEIDAGGRVAAPGFIDAHTHDDRLMLSSPDMPAKVSQGVTSVVAGNCGISLAPAPKGMRAPVAVASFSMASIDASVSVRSLPRGTVRRARLSARWYMSPLSKRGPERGRRTSSTRCPGVWPGAG